MKYLITPRVDSSVAACLDQSLWVEARGQALGGDFYDYLRNPGGALVGVRYWIDGSISFSNHPVFELFIDDSRFRFNKEHGCVDMVFSSGSESDLQNGMLSVETVQQLGGECVMKNGTLFGIFFDICAV